MKSLSWKVLKSLQEDPFNLALSQIDSRCETYPLCTQRNPHCHPKKGATSKSAKISEFSESAHPSQQPPSAASSSNHPRGQPAAFPGASQQSPRGQPAVSQSTSQNGIIHTHLDHVNMSQCTFSFYVICYLYWFGCVSFFSAVSFTFQLE